MKTNDAIEITNEYVCMQYHTIIQKKTKRENNQRFENDFLTPIRSKKYICI